MTLTPEVLRSSVAAVMREAADAYARFDAPFDDAKVAGRFAGLTGAHPEVASRLARAYCSMSNDFGDGGKAAVLIACGIVRAALSRLPAEGRASLPTAIDLAATRSAKAVERAAVQLRNRDDLERVAVTAAAGNDAIGAAIVEALGRAGRDGIVHVNSGTQDDPPGITLRDGQYIASHGREVTVVLKQNTEAETTAAYCRGVTTMYAAMAGVVSGGVPGGGVAYCQAAGSLRSQTEEDTVTGLAALAVSDGLEVPLRVRAEAAGLDTDAVIAVARNDAGVAFDQTRPGLVPVADGPLDPARVVQASIREAGRAACDLLRLAL